jgi:hypothetical protein
MNLTEEERKFSFGPWKGSMSFEKNWNDDETVVESVTVNVTFGPLNDEYSFEMSPLEFR